MEPTNNAGLQRRIRDALYQLKLDWGVLVDVYKLVSSETDYDTGLKTESITKKVVRRAIKMTAETARASYISPYFTQTNKPFITKGSGWDEVTDVFIFEGRDLRAYEFEIQDWIVWNHTRFEVKSFEELGNGAGWVVLTTMAKGSPACEIYEKSSDSEITFSQDVGLDRQYSLSGSMSIDQQALALLESLRLISETLSITGQATAVSDRPVSATSTLGVSDAVVDEYVPGAFVSTWQTANTSSGSTGAAVIKLPLESGGTYNFNVDWGDGTDDTITTWNQAEVTHDYAGTTGVGEYTITITGTCTGWRFNNTGDRLKILNISSWGTLRLGTSVGGHFYGCANLTLSTPDNTLDMTGVQRMDASFAGCSSMTSFPVIDTSNALDFGFCWSGCTGLLSFPELDYSSCTAIDGAWNGCSSMASFASSDFPATVTNFAQTWKNCGLTSFPVCDLSNGTNFFETWRGCSSMTSFSAQNFAEGLTFGSTWNGCTSLTSFGLCLFPKATSVSLAWYDTPSLKTFPACTFPVCTDFTSAWRFMGLAVTFEDGFDVSAGTGFTTTWSATEPIFEDANFGLQFDNLTGTVTFTWQNTTALNAQYTQFLIDIESLGTSSLGITAGSVKYNAGAATARADLISRGWTISDGGAA